MSISQDPWGQLECLHMVTPWEACITCGPLNGKVWLERCIGCGPEGSLCYHKEDTGGMIRCCVCGYGHKKEKQ